MRKFMKAALSELWEFVKEDFRATREIGWLTPFQIALLSALIFIVLLIGEVVK